MTNNDGRDLETAVLHTCRQLRNVSCSPGIEALALGSTSPITPHRRWTGASPAAARPLVDAEPASEADEAALEQVRHGLRLYVDGPW